MDARQNAIFIVTGLSGAGKSQVIRCFEDLGFLCVDNLIPALLPQFIELTYPRMGQIAIVIDLRGGSFFQELPPVLERLRKDGYPARVVFLEASDEVLLHRFSETRRRHPLWGQSTLESSIRDERDQLAEIRAQADVILDTSELSTRQLKEKLIASFIQTDQASQSMQVTVKSFGFKFGPPMDADLVLDVRFLPNPHYIPELKPFTGLHEPVADFVLSHPVTLEFLERFLDLASFLLPHYSKEGKTHLAIAIGCTGGRHRSVAIAHQLAMWFRRDGYAVVEEHRDIDKQNDLYTRDAVRGPA
ncbi:MAG: RNase adapter RapZ [bacterium]|nr:RNase adapter RapZ [bacterium]